MKNLYHNFLLLIAGSTQQELAAQIQYLKEDGLDPGPKRGEGSRDRCVVLIGEQRRTKKCTRVAVRAFPDGKSLGRNRLISVVIRPRIHR